MGTSTERREDAGLKAALCTGKPKAAFFPTSADQPIISSKPFATLSRATAADRCELLDYLEAWYRTRANDPADVKFGSAPQDRPKSAAWITGENDGRLAQLIVWSTGEAELSLGFDSDPQVNEHHELSTRVELDVVLGHVSSWLDAASD
jgi:hypothetical protein